MAKVAVLLPRQELQTMSEQLIGSYKRLSPMSVEYIQTQNAAQRAREMEQQGCEIIIARGLQALLMRQAVKIPVIGIMITTQELGLLTHQLKRETGLIHPKIGLIGFENMLSDTSHFDELFDAELVRYTITSAEDNNSTQLLSAFVRQAMQEGCQAIMGGDVTCACAKEYGLPSIYFASGLESLRNAFSTAEQLAYAIDLEKRDSAEMNTMLDFTFSGIMQIDADGVIRRGNRVLYNLLGIRPADMIGQPIQKVLPQLHTDMLDRVLLSGEESYASLVPIENRAVVLNAAPVLIEGQISGAILTFQESRRITEISGELRREMYQRGLVARYRFDRLPLADAGMKKMISRAKQFARYSAPILIKGERGVGSAMMAQCLHNESLARANAFVEVDCEAYSPEVLDTILFGSYSTRPDSPAGLAEAAQNGTLFLGHVDKLSLDLQYKVLQLLRGKLLRNGVTHPITSEVRILAFTHKDLITCVKSGAFRSDLYYELSVLSLELPPLRRRRDDILPWVEFYLDEAQEHYKRYITLTQGARDYLRNYDWPGNLDQLHSMCERTVLTAERRSVDEVFFRRELEQLEPRVAEDTQQIVLVKDPKGLHIADLLRQYNGDRQKVADELGISKTTLWRYMKKYGIGQDFSC